MVIFVHISVIRALRLSKPKPLWELIWKRILVRKCMSVLFVMWDLRRPVLWNDIWSCIPKLKWNISFVNCEWNKILVNNYVTFYIFLPTSIQCNVIKDYAYLNKLNGTFSQWVTVNWLLLSRTLYKQYNRYIDRSLWMLSISMEIILSTF